MCFGMRALRVPLRTVGTGVSAPLSLSPRLTGIGFCEVVTLCSGRVTDGGTARSEVRGNGDKGADTRNVNHILSRIYERCQPEQD